ncbi:hypothetical protein J6590_017588 [Homalodisca vitripennis]|nr:hypothetical protein J6590_017588 [Homalodisca vitripennis]
MIVPRKGNSIGTTQRMHNQNTLNLIIKNHKTYLLSEGAELAYYEKNQTEESNPKGVTDALRPNIRRLSSDLRRHEALHVIGLHDKDYDPYPQLNLFKRSAHCPH